MNTQNRFQKIMIIILGIFAAQLAQANSNLNPGTKVDGSEALPLALVYNGKGACGPCAKGAADAANAAGLNVLFVTEKLTDFSVFEKARVWIQPGGTSANVIKTLSPDYVNHIRGFISAGGGYVGFCAGAFFSTTENGSTGLPGLGIVPGKTEALFKDFSPEDHAYLLHMTWNGEKRVVYFNGGAYFDLTGVSDPNLVVLATYDDYGSKIAALSTRFGSGKVAVSGAHPEELNWVKLAHGKIDPDGNDQDLAVKMIHMVIE